jgi:hypothetical protein
VNITDRVVSTPSESACYVMQQLHIAARRVLAFYDSGANSNIVEYDLARDAGFHQIGFQTVSSNVAIDIECQALDQITGTFPTFRLDNIITEARATFGLHHVFPQEIGGAPVKLLIGIRSMQLAPVLKLTIPSGLCVYGSKFRDVYGAMLCFGGVYPRLQAIRIPCDVGDAPSAIYGIGHILHGRHSSSRRSLHRGGGSGWQPPQCSAGCSYSAAQTSWARQRCGQKLLTISQVPPWL